MSQIIIVKAVWDQEASVWVASSKDVPGLVTEAETCEDLICKLQVMIPEMLELNGVSVDSDDIPFQLRSEMEMDAVAHRIAC